MSVSFQVDFHLDGPVLTKASEARMPLIDASYAVNAEGKPMIPRSLVKGKLREAWEELEGIHGENPPFALEEWLGPDARADRAEAPGELRLARARLSLLDFMLTSAGSSQTQHRIQMDPETGSVGRHMLMTLVAFGAPGIEVRASGRLDADVPEAEAPGLQRWLGKVLGLIGNLGSHRGIGYGWVRRVEIQRIVTPALPRKVVRSQVNPCSLRFALRLDRPFLFAEPKTGDNQFKGAIRIPGAAVAAVLVESAKQMPGLAGGRFDRLVFSFLRPVKPGEGGGALPVEPPLSLAVIAEPPKTAASTAEGRVALQDMAWLESPELVNGRAPRFRLDWKAHELSAALKHFGWPDVAHSIRVRTAMNASTGRSLDEHLFVYQEIAAHEHEWAGWVDASGLSEAEIPAAMQALHTLLSRPLRGLGKTKAVGEVTFLREEGTATPPKSSRAATGARVWTITLQTPGLLLNPGDFPREAGGLISTRPAYEAAWKMLLPGCHLRQFFAQEGLRGGEYLHRRFRPGQAYRPWLLSEAGSVFVLEEGQGGPDIAATLAKWSRSGLPLRADMLGIWGGDWRSNPYLPQNGYGQIAVNLSPFDAGIIRVGGRS